MNGTNGTKTGSADVVLSYAATATGQSVQRVRDIVSRDSAEFSDSEYLDADLLALWKGLSLDSRALVLVIAEAMADRASDKD